MKKTQKEIQEQIDWLKTNKSKIPHYTFFGDDNHRKVDIEIMVLEKGLIERDVRNWNNNDEGFTARDIIDWRNGINEEGCPSENWGSLVK